MNRPRILGLALFAAAIVLGSGLVAYSWSKVETHEGLAILRAGDFHTFDFRQVDAEAEASFRVAVEAGPPVDVYVLGEADYARYLAGQPVGPLLGAFAYENVTEVDESPYPAEGLWHVVIDNTDYGVARPAGAAATVRFRVATGGMPFVPFFGGLAVSVLLAILGFVLIVVPAISGSAPGLPHDQIRGGP